MSASRGRYTTLQTSREDEMEAAFESDDEGSDNDDVSRPMLPPRSTTPPPVGHTRGAQSVTAGGYNFERVFDYDVPPPGSPPRLSERALPNTIGNSNGVLSDAPVWRPAPNFIQRGLRSLFPSRYARVPTTEPVGGGRANDGVFANVTAKPTPARVEVTPDGVHVMPEEAQKDLPPSYSAAQADSVPPYWETTVHAPSASVQGEMIVDNLPTGTLFSFLWNMLISLSFNFVGFLLTYLLHTTHAAKYGSRAGLGITLLQYGFALRGRDDGTAGGGDADTWPWVDLPDPESPPEPQTSGVPSAGNSTATAPDPGGMDTNAPYTQEWVAFFLMTIGWFLVLTSFLGYWRVKRWEHQILVANAAAAASAPAPSAPAVGPTISVAQQIARDRAISRNLEVLFGLSRHVRGNDSVGRERDLESGRESSDTNMTPEERRLRVDLRAAGLI